MNIRRNPPTRQRGSFMLEALIAILIVALGVLGSVGLLARAMQDVDDSKFRGEAAFLANAMLGEMWASDRKTVSLDAAFGSAGSGPKYLEYQTLAAQHLPGGASPSVVVIGGPNPTSSIVTITVTWALPGDNDPARKRTGGANIVHQYIANGTIAGNQ